MMKTLPSQPNLFCLKITGPPEETKIIKLIKTINGIESKKKKAPKVTSSALFNNKLTPTILLTFKSITGNPKNSVTE